MKGTVLLSFSLLCLLATLASGCRHRYDGRGYSYRHRPPPASYAAPRPVYMAPAPVYVVPRRW